MVQSLVKKGANPNNGIGAAALSGQESIVKYLVEQCADPNNGINEASSAGHESILMFLVSKGASVPVKENIPQLSDEVLENSSEPVEQQSGYCVMC
jgi:hypothetical protein